MRISAHRGSKRAYVAVAHSMLVAIYHILKGGVAFKNLGADYYNQFNKERKINAYLKKLKAWLGSPGSCRLNFPDKFKKFLLNLAGGSLRFFGYPEGYVSQ